MRLDRRQQARRADLGRIAGAGQQHRPAPQGEFGGQGLCALAGLVVLGQGQHREVAADQGHGAVAHLGGAEGLGVQAAGLLELQRRFLGRAQADAAADHIQAARVLQRLQRRAPVQAPGPLHLAGQDLQGGVQGRVAGPAGDQVQEGGIGRQI